MKSNADVVMSRIGNQKEMIQILEKDKLIDGVQNGNTETNRVVDIKKKRKNMSRKEKIKEKKRKEELFKFEEKTNIVKANAIAE
jgi:hypothetical protein